MHGHTKRNAHQRAQHRKRHNLQNARRRKVKGLQNGKARGRQTKEQRNTVTRQRCDKAGDKRHIVKNAHRKYFKGEYRRGQRCTKQCSKYCTHAAHSSYTDIAVVLPEQPSHLAADAAADLQRCPLAAGAAAHHMGEHRGKKNHRRQHQGYLLPKVDGMDNVVGSLPLHLGDAIDPDHQKARRRHQIQQPRMRTTQGRHRIHAHVERRTNQAAHQSNAGRDHGPFEKSLSIVGRARRFPAAQCRSVSCRMPSRFPCTAHFSPSDTPAAQRPP